MRELWTDARGPDDDDAAAADTSGLYLDIHSHSRLVLWRWGHTSETAPNGTALQTLGRKLAYDNDYVPHPSHGLYPVNGSTDDYAYGELGRAGFTYELGTTFFRAAAPSGPASLNRTVARCSTASRWRGRRTFSRRARTRSTSA